MDRLLLVLLFSFCSNAFVLDCQGPRHSLQVGQRARNDLLDYVDHVKLDYKFLQVLDSTMTYPPDNEETSSKIINYIEVIDQFSNGKGGCAIITSGGIGHNFTTIEFTSRRNHGLDFVVRIFVTKYF